jgi:magnesium chelatase family protein
LDRFDLRVAVTRPEPDELFGTTAAESTAQVRKRVALAEQRAFERGRGHNGVLTATDLEEVAPLTQRAEALLRAHLADGRLSGRGLARIRRVARTIADLDDGVDHIGDHHVALALQLRVSPSPRPARVAGRVMARPGASLPQSGLIPTPRDEVAR